jgi:hypothetical protein
MHKVVHIIHRYLSTIWGQLHWKTARKMDGRAAQKANIRFKTVQFGMSCARTKAASAASCYGTNPQARLSLTHNMLKKAAIDA